MYVFPLLAVYVILSVASCLMPAAWNVTARGLTKTMHEGSNVLYVVTATKVDVEQ